MTYLRGGGEGEEEDGEGGGGGGGGGTGGGGGGIQGRGGGEVIVVHTPTHFSSPKRCAPSVKRYTTRALRPSSYTRRTKMGASATRPGRDKLEGMYYKIRTHRPSLKETLSHGTAGAAGWGGKSSASKVLRRFTASWVGAKRDVRGRASK